MKYYLVEGYITFTTPWDDASEFLFRHIGFTNKIEAENFINNLRNLLAPYYPDFTNVTITESY